MSDPIPTPQEEEEELDQTLLDRQGKNALHRACHIGDLEKVKYLVSKGYQTEYTTRTESRASPFLVAVRAGHLEVAKWLVGARKHQEMTPEAYVQSQKDSVASTSMMYAVESGNLELVRWLDEMGVSVFERNQRGSTVMMWATRDKSIEIIKWLVSKGLSLTERNGRQMSAASYAAFDGQLEVMKYFLSQGVPFDIISASGYSMMLLAVESGVIENVKWLISIGQGGSLSDVNADGAGCIYLAATHGKLEMLKWLHQEMGFSLKTKPRATVAAVKSGNLEVLEYLIQSGQKLKETPNDSESLCMLAAIGGHVSMLECLVSKGISLERRNKRQDTVETVAAMKGQVAVLKWLIEVQGRTPHVVNRFGCGLAWWAAKNGHIYVLEYLASVGVNLQHLDKDKESPAMQAAYHGQLAALKWLYRYGCPLNQRGTHNGYNCMSAALAQGQIETVEWLLSVGMDLYPFPSQLADSSANWLRSFGMYP